MSPFQFSFKPVHGQRILKQIVGTHENTPIIPVVISVPATVAKETFTTQGNPALDEPEQSSADLAAVSNDELISVVVGCFTKIKDALPYIKELRLRFKNLSDAERIADCKTWSEFCAKVLHRTDRAIRKAIAAEHRPRPQRPCSEPKSDSPKPGPWAESDEFIKQSRHWARYGITAYPPDTNQNIKLVFENLDLATAKQLADLCLRLRKEAQGCV